MKLSELAELLREVREVYGARVDPEVTVETARNTGEIESVQAVFGPNPDVRIFLAD